MLCLYIPGQPPYKENHLNGHLPVLQLYTLFSTVLFVIFLPVILLVTLLKNKYRGKTLQRLGLTLGKQLPQDRLGGAPVIWVHALSVGEVTSALPLISGLRRRYPGSLLYFSTTTTTGQATAKRLSKGQVDAVFFSPFDMFFSVQHFIRILRPSLFILVETDFWPGWLYCLKKYNIPSLLVNGRFSKQSLDTYRRFAFLSRPMFSCFTLLSMQTQQDAEAILSLGVPRDKIIQLGNLKFDATTPGNSLPNKTTAKADLGLPEEKPLLICGSTHRGEEKILFGAYCEIKKTLPELCLLIAPRDINRRDEIATLAQSYGLQITRRSDKSAPPPLSGILLLDTLGELAGCYQLADIALIGGSLVPAGGHNPLEAATFGIPILFGPHMEDFAEISRDLVTAGGAQIITNSEELVSQTLILLNSPELFAERGAAARDIVQRNKGVVERHLNIVAQHLHPVS